MKDKPVIDEWTTIRQNEFINEFLIDLNATRAYKKAYWASQKVAEVNGCKLLSNTKVKNIIDAKLKERFAKADIDWQWVINQLVLLVNRCMQWEPVMKMNYETKELEETGEWKFDSAWANSALDKLGKYFKLFTENVKIEWEIKSIQEIKITVWS